MSIWVIALSGQILSVVNHRLFWKVCNVLGKLMPTRLYTCEVILKPDSVMKIYLDDPYWSRLVADSYEHEPEISYMLNVWKDIPYVFLDCGANFGYWSVMVSSRYMGNHEVLAIEASQETFAILQQNCTLNNHRFRCVNLAISSSSGQKVHIDTSSHHSEHTISYALAHEKDECLVLTTTLDDVIEQHFSEPPDCVLVKLDVEGEEINALKGASGLLSRDVLFCYEDHGKDSESQVTQYILEELGLTVLFCTDDRRIIQIRTAEEASRYKTRNNYGYNFFACKEQSRYLQALSSISLEVAE